MKSHGLYFRRFCRIVLATIVLAGLGGSSFAAQDVFRDRFGVDYSIFARDLQTAFSSARSDIMSAEDLFLTQDRSGFYLENAGEALRLQMRAQETIFNFTVSYAKVETALPILFVQLKDLTVRSIHDITMIQLAKDAPSKDRIAAHELLVEQAEELRHIIAMEMQQNLFPSLHATYQQVDEETKQYLTGSFMILALEYSSNDRPLARKYAGKALALNPNDQKLKDVFHSLDLDSGL